MATPEPIWGFGSPDALPGLSTPLGTYYDWGFGDPEPTAWAGVPLDFGFGDPPAPELAVVPYITPIKPDHVYPDKGGELVSLEGTWGAALPKGTNGPYRVRLVDAVGQLWPDALGCYSAVSGAGPACETNDSQSKLRFGMPPLPPGVYNVEVAWGPGYVNSVLLSPGLRVILRGRNLHTYNLRKQTFPSPFAAGPRSLDMDRRLGLPEGV